MKQRSLACLAISAALLLSGCSSMLDREYLDITTHNAAPTTEGDTSILRADSYQELVNVLIYMVSTGAENGTIRLYIDSEDVAKDLEDACREVVQEDPLGAYAVEYITASSRSQRGYYEISIQVSYRRTAEQIQAVVNATSTEALSALLEAALDEGRTELAVRVGYWGEDGQARVEETVAQLREARGLAETPPWTISYYPAQGPVGLIEFVMGGDAAAAAEENSENLAEES